MEALNIPARAAQAITKALGRDESRAIRRGARLQAEVEREDKVIALVFAGRSFRQIGKLLGFSHARAHYVYQRALKRRAVKAGSEKVRAREISRIETLLAPEMEILLAPAPSSPELAQAHAARANTAFERIIRLLPLFYMLQGFSKRGITMNIGRQAGANVREGHVHLHGFDPRTATDEQRRAIIEQAQQARILLAARSGPPDHRGGTT